MKKTKHHGIRRYAMPVGLFVLMAIAMWLMFLSSSQSANCAVDPKLMAVHRLQPPTTAKMEQTTTHLNNKEEIQLAPYHEKMLDLTILPNELPGYTGWARPVHTLVDSFRIVRFSHVYATAGQDWSVQVECNHELCQRGKSLFYVRAYGRSILPGRVQDHENGTYTMTILPHDVGRYTLEVVLVCSLRPDWNDLPLPGQPGEPDYEGYLVPGFPVQFSVKPAYRKTQSSLEEQEELRQKKNASKTLDRQMLQLQKQSSPRPVCTAKQLIETSPNSALTTGRWLVVNKTRSLPFTPHHEIKGYHADKVNLQEYMKGFSSVGFQMDYIPLECDILSLEAIENASTWLNVWDKQKTSKWKTKKLIHILFIGDSNVRNQYNFFRDHIAIPTNYLKNQLRLTYVEMMNSFPRTFPRVKQVIHNITRDFQDDLFFSIFNLGLHDIIHRCTIFGIRTGSVVEGRCPEMYQKDLRELIEVVQRIPSLLNVWQSTTAGWPKWGVYGVSWPQHVGQKMTQDPTICEYTNELAWKVVSQEAKIPVMDTYWLTVSRPDHREVVEREEIRTFYKLVHLGPEVYSLLGRKFTMMILEAIENGKEGESYL